MRIVGVLGGSFNPIHNAHLQIAECAHMQYNIPEILIIPTAKTYYKNNSELINANYRIDMINLAINEINAADHLKVSCIDIDRGGITYTYDTINDLKDEYDKIFFIIGTDSLMYIDKWMNAGIFLRECTLLVGPRGSHSKEEIDKQCDLLQNDYGAVIKFLDTELSPISSSEIRKMIRNKKSVKTMLPDSVLQYIIKNRLYI